MAWKQDLARHCFSPELFQDVPEVITQADFASEARLRALETH